MSNFQKIAALLAAVVVFQAISFILDVYSRVKDSNFFLLGLFYLMTLIISSGLTWALWKLFRFNIRTPKRKLNLTELKRKIAELQAEGINTDDLEHELAALEAPSVSIEVAFFGRISTGKSSLIQTLIPSANVNISIIGGSTEEVERYHYKDECLELTLLDMPGTQQAIITKDTLAIEAARRVHVVVYVIDQDLTHSDLNAINELTAFGKPILVVLNKINLYTEEERQQLTTHIKSVLPNDIKFSCASSFFVETIRRTNLEGVSEIVERQNGGNVNELLEMLLEITSARDQLNYQQKQSLIRLTDEKIHDKLKIFRRQLAEEVVRKTIKRSAYGSVATIAPGSDLLIQGYVGVDMFRKLTKIYEVKMRDIDIEELVQKASKRANTTLIVPLAITGNVMKAFVGIGTVSGAAVHALAYCLFFDSLGRAGIELLEQGNANTNDILMNFEEQLSNDLEKRAKFFSTFLDRK